MAGRIIRWWKSQSVLVKVLTGIFVGLAVVVTAVLLRGKVSESSVVDAAEAEYVQQSNRRKADLEELDGLGKNQIDRADATLLELKDRGSDEARKREERDEVLIDAGSWSDLDDELGKPRSG